MKIEEELNNLIERYPSLDSCKKEILLAYEILLNALKGNKTIFVAGNGGSSADADHIVGELVKGFYNAKPLDSNLINKLENIDKQIGSSIAQRVQKGYKVISLTNNSGLLSAFSNDVEDGWSYAYAQELSSLGNEGDVFLGITTSGNSKNIIAASVMASAKNMKVVSLTGQGGGNIKNYSDVCIAVKENVTHKVQELHLPIYHFLCLMLHNELD